MYRFFTTGVLVFLPVLVFCLSLLHVPPLRFSGVSEEAGNEPGTVATFALALTPRLDLILIIRDLSIRRLIALAVER